MRSTHQHNQSSSHVRISLAEESRPLFFELRRVRFLPAWRSSTCHSSVAPRSPNFSSATSSDHFPYSTPRKVTLNIFRTLVEPRAGPTKAAERTGVHLLVSSRGGPNNTRQGIGPGQRLGGQARSRSSCRYSTQALAQ